MRPGVTRQAGPPTAASVLAVVAHPDDESFGLGAVLSALHATGARVAVICFTHGEASTLGAEALDGRDLHTARALELADAAAALGVEQVDLLSYRDGGLSTVALEELADHVEAAASRSSSDMLVVFDLGGITGHPDHVRATEAAMAAAGRLDLPVLAWAIEAKVAARLNSEFATTFVGREGCDVDFSIAVDRTEQLAAIACHRTQSGANPVLWRRLELTGAEEPLRLLRGRRARAATPTTA